MADVAGFYVRQSGHGPGHLIIYPPVTTTTIPITFTPARIALTTITKAPVELNARLAPEQLDPTSDNLNPHTKKDGKKGDLVIDINDVVEMKKVGLSKIGKMALEWALDVEGAGGTGLELTIRRNKGNSEAVGYQQPKQGAKELEVIKLGGIVRRDELFDRLLALGEQRWELL
jgi:hypothetical protein